MNFNQFALVSVLSTVSVFLWVTPIYAEFTESASHAWIPGAMVEVEVVQHVTQIDESGKARLVDVQVEVKEVFTGPASLKGRRVLINPRLAFRFPPERWCALGLEGLMGDSIEAIPLGTQGFLWIFQRQELLTSIDQGKEFQFFTGFSPVWQTNEHRAEETKSHRLVEVAETRELMEMLRNLEALDDAEKEQRVLGLLEHENAKVREWALAALLRVKGIGAMPLLERFRTSTHVSQRIATFLNGIGARSASEQPGDKKEAQTISVAPLIGIEVVTKHKVSGPPNLLSPAKITELGTVRVLRVFSGSGIAEGDILPAETATVAAGTKLLVSPRKGTVVLNPQDWSFFWSFPPLGLWDGENKRLGFYAHSPALNLQPLLPWLHKISNHASTDAGEFLDEAIRSAPFHVALWALGSYSSQLRPDTLEWLEASLGIKAQASAATDVSLRNLGLYDAAMSRIFGKLWLWDVRRDWVMERIVAHPLTNEEEAWLLYEILTQFWEGSDSGSQGRWIRLAKAARENSSWQNDWIDPTYRSQFDHTAWTYTRTESRARFDASPGIDYLLERWARPDRGQPATSVFVDSRGSELARFLPLKPKEVEALRAALAARLAGSGDSLSPESVEQMLGAIRAVSWQEISEQSFP